ncbi:MAG: polyprenol monophosphomannose synthase [Candidatus Acidulodesulfobacterium acidiphilum]|uniref:Polyprenol monophosphomannose synthase n=1 Tax=Candidatus Acidulodesulfobacterium acidiphilum TaxID=2597224 RepID=A0A520XC19_9DELT|nr:MAG: polyprenol monophosphomannose synthase [Candidatus Acidulodesulfobacterium acidiphilum]
MTVITSLRRPDIFKPVVILPTYNEKDNIELLVNNIFSLPNKISILIVDDNSPDGTGVVADSLSKEYPDKVYVLHRNQKNGLGTAYIEGFKFAIDKGFDCIITMDADISHDFNTIPLFLNEIKDCDFVIGSRYINGIRILNWDFKRLLLSKLANFYVNKIGGLPFTDATGGFNCFRTDTIKSININKLSSIGYSFLIEIKFKIFKKGFMIKEIPIVFSQRNAGISKLSKKVFFEAMFMVLKLRLGLHE